MRILVTGAAGFIGSSLSERLLQRGDEVVGLDNFDPFYARSLKERNLQALRSYGQRFSFSEGDILDAELLDRLLATGVERVVHLAALAGVRPSLSSPRAYMRVNVEGTVNVLEACRRARVANVVVASSSSVYGARSQVPFAETDSCDEPASPYAASKKATETVCATYHQLYGLAITALRFFTVYGPRQRPEMAIHKFVRDAFLGAPLPRFGDGESGRDYTYVDDIVDGIIAALDKQEKRFRIYNLGGSRPITLNKLLEAISQATGRQLIIDAQPEQAGDVPITCADVTRSEAELGYRPRVTIQEGLKRFVVWYKENEIRRD